MLGDITVADEIYVICGYTDMRKSIDGLCAVVKRPAEYEPFQAKCNLSLLWQT